MSNFSLSPYHRLRRLKAALLAVSFTLAGILLMMLNAWIAPLRLGDWQWLHALPLGELGGTLFGAGLLSTFFEYAFRRDQEAHTLARFRQIIREEAPAMRDAVVEGFAIHPEDLKRVATPELLDDIAANVMALRLGDEQFAREIYRDIRDQAIRAAERWVRRGGARSALYCSREEYRRYSSARRHGGVGVHHRTQQCHPALRVCV